MKLLKPAYILSLTLQKSDCSIGEVVPSIYSLLSKWESMKSKSNTGSLEHRFCELLISSIKEKFKNELSADGKYYWVSKIIID